MGATALPSASLPSLPGLPGVALPGTVAETAPIDFAALLLGQMVTPETPTDLEAGDLTTTEPVTEPALPADALAILAQYLPVQPPVLEEKTQTAAQLDAAPGIDAEDESGNPVSVSDLIATVSEKSLLAPPLTLSNNTSRTDTKPEIRVSEDDLRADLSVPGSKPQLQQTPGQAPVLSSPDKKSASDQAVSDSANLAGSKPMQPSFSETLTAATTTVQGQQTSLQSNVTASEGHMKPHDLPRSVTDSRWGQDFSEKIVWIAKNEQQTAQININPPQLGPIQINLNLSGDQVTATFASPHLEIRQAIEEALPKLREMMSGAGIQLGNANVGAQLPQQRDPSAQFAGNTRFSGENDILSASTQPSVGSVPLPIQRGRGLVDLFA